MQGFTIVDAIVVVIIVMSAILAYSRGVVRELLAIGGWIVAAVVAYTFAHQAEPLVQEIPVLGKFLKGSCELSLVAAFAVVFAVGLVVLAFFTPLLSSLVRNSVLGGIDQGMGFLFGVLRGLVLIAAAFIAYHRTMAAESVPVIDHSRSAKVFAQFEGQINSQIPDQLPQSLVKLYDDLAGSCGTAANGGGLNTGTPAPVAPAAKPATGTTAPAAPSGTTSTAPSATISN
ncbi:MAG: CvpA family protein [Paracoccaceae bacterium]|nr:CvpA family protein [Paracoccaceae bacterium]MDE3238760.1 CvpA family protein [Paracoccaceae bacterium]